jgi:hypothetical protein
MEGLNEKDRLYVKIVKDKIREKLKDFELLNISEEYGNYEGIRNLSQKLLDINYIPSKEDVKELICLLKNAMVAAADAKRLESERAATALDLGTGLDPTIYYDRLYVEKVQDKIREKLNDFELLNIPEEYGNYESIRNLSQKLLDINYIPSKKDVKELICLLKNAMVAAADAKRLESERSSTALDWGTGLDPTIDYDKPMCSDFGVP